MDGERRSSGEAVSLPEGEAGGGGALDASRSSSCFSRDRCKFSKQDRQ